MFSGPQVLFPKPYIATSYLEYKSLIEDRV